MKKLLPVCLLGIAFMVMPDITPLAADRGAISFLPGVLLREPRQQAVLAWNETEQILVLSTDLSASQETRVLQVMPFPSEPQIAEADVRIFRQLHQIAWSSFDRSPPLALRGGALTEGPQVQPPGEITFHERIGSHELFTIRADRLDGFVDWVHGRLRDLGVDQPTIPSVLRRSVEDYIREGYRWFVFDVVDLSPELRTLEAISYRFATDALFFPLKISRTGHGETDITLYVLTTWSAESMYLGDPLFHLQPNPGMDRWREEQLEQLKQQFEQMSRPSAQPRRSGAAEAPTPPAPARPAAANRGLPRVTFDGVPLRSLTVTPVPGFDRSDLHTTVMPELDALFPPDRPPYFSIWELRDDLQQLSDDLVVRVQWSGGSGK